MTVIYTERYRHRRGIIGGQIMERNIRPEWSYAGENPINNHEQLSICKGLGCRSRRGIGYFYVTCTSCDICVHDECYGNADNWFDISWYDLLFRKYPHLFSKE